MDPEPTQFPGEVDVELIDALVQTSFGVVSVVGAVAARHDLSLTQVRVLAILRNHTPTMSELADHLGLERSTVSGLVDRAAARGLIERVDNPDDRRSSRVTLTPEGRRLAALGEHEVAERLQPRLAVLTPAERTRLTRLLTRG